MACSDRRGKLSLKRRRNAECSGDDDATASVSSAISKEAREDGRFTAGLPISQPAAQSPEPYTKAMIPFQGNDSATHPVAFHTAKRQSVNVEANIALSRQRNDRLPELPPWYGLKENEEQETPLMQEIIKIGDVSIEWRPLPTYCRVCLVRSKHQRAVELQKHSSPCKATSGLKKNDDMQILAQNVQSDATKLHVRTEGSSPPRNERGDVSGELREDFDPGREFAQQKSGLMGSSRTQNLPNNRRYPTLQTDRIDQDEPPLVHRICSSKTNLNHDATSTTIEEQRSPPPKKSPHLSIPTSKTERTAPNLRFSRKCDPLESSSSHIDSSKKSNSPSFKRKSTNKSLPSRNGKGDDIQKEVIEKLDLDSEILKAKSGPMISSQTKNSSNTEMRSNFSDVPSKATGFSFKENVNSKTKSLIDQRLSAFVKKAPNTSTIAPRNGKKAPSSSTSDLQLVRKYSLNANSNKSKHHVYPNDSPRKPLALTSQTSSESATSRRHQQENYDLNLSSPEVIVLDSDSEKEEALPTLPVLSPSSLSTGSKRKFSETSSDTDKKIAKKPKLLDSVAGASGSLATRLTPEPKSRTVTEHSRGQFEQLFGAQCKTAQAKLDGMLVRTTKPDVSKMSPSSLQASSTRKSILGNPCYHSHPKLATSSREVGKQVIHISSTASKSSSRNIFWNLSSNVKPLFKKKQPEKPDAEPTKKPQHVLAKFGANVSNSSFSNCQTQNQKVFQETGAGVPRKTYPDLFSKDAATTSTKSPLRKMANFTSPAPDVLCRNLMSREPKNQSAFRPNQEIGELGRQPGEPLTPSANQQNASTPSYSGFQSARDVRTNQDTYPKLDSRTNPSRNKWANQDIHPKWDNRTNSAWDIGTNQDMHPKQDIRTNQGIGHPKRDIKSTQNNAKIVHKDTNRDNKSNLVSYHYVNMDQHTDRGTKDTTTIQNCPLCQLQFPQSWTSFQRDRHIAVCLSESSGDVSW